MTGRPGWRDLSSAVIRFAGSSAKRVKASPFSDPAPAVEDLHDLGAGLNLLVEIFDRGLGQKRDQRAEGLRVLLAQLVGGGLIRRTTTRDHVGRDRPWRARETDQRGLRRKLPRQDAHGLVDRREVVVDVVLALERTSAPRVR